MQNQKLEKQLLRDLHKQDRQAKKQYKKDLAQQNKAFVAAKKIRKKQHKAKELAKPLSWFRLDNAATIYPSIQDENWNFVFRVSAVLNEEVDKKVLQKAVDETMPRFPSFNVGLKKGVFWNYFEELPKAPIVEEEQKFPCTQFNISRSKYHLVRVIYYKNRVSVEVFHAICDGRSALKFFNSLLRHYFELLGKKLTGYDGCLDTKDRPAPEELQDSFFENATDEKGSKHKEQKAFKISGTPEEYGVVNSTMGIMSVSQIKEIAKKYNTGLFQFLASVLGLSIWRKNKHAKRPIKLSIPIDLRSFFPSKSLRNFSGYVNVVIPPAKDYTLEQIIEIVKAEFSRISKENMQGFINGNIGFQKNPLIKIVPLFIKNLVVKLCYKSWGEVYQTVAVSNIGLVSAPPEFVEYVDKYEVNLGRPKYNPYSIGVISFNDKLVWTFSSKIKENVIERTFFTNLASLGAKVCIETNRRDLYV